MASNTSPLVPPRKMAFAAERRGTAEPSLAAHLAAARTKVECQRKQRVAESQAQTLPGITRGVSILTAGLTRQGPRASGSCAPGSTKSSPRKKDRPGAHAAKRAGLLSSNPPRASSTKAAPKPNNKGRAQRTPAFARPVGSLARSKAGSWPKPKPLPREGKNGKKKKKKTKLPSLVASTLPTNLEEEKLAFFRNRCQTNPVFQYKDDASSGVTRAHKRYGVPDMSLFALSKQILDQTLAEYGSETSYMDRNYGPPLTLEQVAECVRHYLEANGIAQTVVVNYIESAASPTSMCGDRLNIRVPCTYRTWRIEGTLSHEIGTHYTRRTNDELMPWHGRRKKWRLAHFLETEVTNTPKPCRGYVPRLRGGLPVFTRGRA